MRLVSLASAAGTLVATGAIVAVLLTQALPFFHAISPWDFLTGTRWRPTAAPPGFGVIPLLTGSLIVTVGSGLISIPIGVLCAIYLCEYAETRVRFWLKLPLELLAGVPAVVYGYLGLFMITPMLRHLSSGFQASNAAAAAVVVGIMIVPLVSALVEDALRSVPGSLREGGYALGMTKPEVILRVILPSAKSGIVAAFILAFSRAVGETVAVTLAAGSTPNLTINPQKSMATMTSYLLTTTQGDAEAGSVRYTSIFAVGLLLFLLTFGANLLASRIVTKRRWNS